MRFDRRHLPSSISPSIWICCSFPIVISPTDAAAFPFLSFYLSLTQSVSHSQSFNSPFVRLRPRQTSKEASVAAAAAANSITAVTALIDVSLLPICAPFLLLLLRPHSLVPENLIAMAQFICLHTHTRAHAETS